MSQTLALVLVFVAAFEPSAEDSAAARTAEECIALFGQSHERAQRRAFRQARLEEVTRSELLLDLTFTDPMWQVPRPVRLPGVEVVQMESNEEGEATARVRVFGPWSERCPEGEYLVSADDGLGSEGIVLAVLEEGVLAEHKGELIFVPKTGAHAPRFRMIWRSGFGLNVEPGKNGSIGAPAKAAPAKGKRAQRQDAKQRAKAQAKAAAENRRNLATKPIRPRG